MAILKLDIPDQAMDRVLEAIAAQNGYNPDNPAHGTKAKFAKRWLAQTLKQYVKAYERGKAHDNIAVELANSEIDIN